MLKRQRIIKLINVSLLIVVITLVVDIVIKIMAINYYNVTKPVTDPVRLTTLSIVWIVLIAPILEEVVFRGGLLVVIHNFRKTTSINVAFAIFLQAVLFAVTHIPSYRGVMLYPQLLLAFSYALITGIAVVKYRTITPGIVAHIIINFANII